MEEPKVDDARRSVDLRDLDQGLLDADVPDEDVRTVNSKTLPRGDDARSADAPVNRKGAEAPDVDADADLASTASSRTLRRGDDARGVDARDRTNSRLMMTKT